jgi:energy-coupling factor transport system ATP-binding protein
VRNVCREGQALLPQNPKALLSHETVAAELMAWSGSCGYGDAEVRGMLARLGLDGDPGLLDRHPYDLSGGQQHLVAMGKLLLARPSLLLLDEPTKGLDAPTRTTFVGLVSELRSRGTTVVVATHDLAFVKATCDTVTLLFGGREACTMACGDFFSSTQFFPP